MAYKILHLPTATYMYYDTTHSKVKNFNYIYTEFEIENDIYGVGKPSNSFTSLKDALEWIEILKLFTKRDSKNFSVPEPLSFEDYEEYPLVLIEHFEVIEVKDV